jgi:hypothetical protein
VTTVIETESGREYTLSRTTTQNIVCKWVDPNGDAQVKGSYQKVWEHCSVGTSTGRVEVGERLMIRGTDRYTLRPVARHTTRIVAIVRNGESLQRL